MADDEQFPDTQIVDISESLDEDVVSDMLDRTVAGKYRILRRLARGGMGVVYMAEHIQLGRKVVIKVLSYHLADDSRAKSRFEREARGLSVLDHPNVVTVHDFGVEKGLTYIVMEYVEGENLSQRVRRKGRITFDELLPIVVQTVDAIAAAHEKGIVHRDVKPSNVMVSSKSGRPNFVKVLDFGLAKLATQSVDITKGNLVGTVSYLSPEVIKGDDAKPSADVYALGIMFYYLLAGSKPFQGSDDMSVLYQHVNEEPAWLGDSVPAGEVPHGFIEFIHKCMDKNPATRPQTAGEMRELLNDVVSMPSISSFSLDSSLALPRYRPPDSSAEVIPSPVLRSQESRTTTERPSIDRSQPSIAMAPPRRGLRIAVVAFTTCSIGLVVALLLMRRSSDREVVQIAPATVAKPHDVIEATPPVEPEETEEPTEAIAKVDPPSETEEPSEPVEKTETKKPVPVATQKQSPTPKPVNAELAEQPADRDAGGSTTAQPDAGTAPAEAKSTSKGLLGVESKRSNLLPVTP